MHTKNFSGLRFWLAIAFSCAILLGLSACTVNVKKDQYGKDKKVDIDTPLGGIHVSKNADVRDTGLTVYPGAKLKEKEEDGEGKSANVNISSGSFRLKVVAVEYESGDAPEKVVTYYKNELKKYGNVLECHTSKYNNVQTKYGDDDSDDLKCEDSSGKNIELKAGRKDNQHIVSIEPRDKGAKFALVLVQTHGKDTI